MKAADFVPVVRTAQALLLLAAIINGLGSTESEGVRRDVGNEKLTISFEAPVQQARGPWKAGGTFTEKDAGIPLDVAPTWTVSARHTVSGIQSTGHGWQAEVETVEVGGENKLWWRVAEPLPIENDGDRAWVILNAQELSARALDMDKAADIPGRLEIRLRFVHTSYLAVGSKEVSTTRSALLTITPETNRALVTVANDGMTFAGPAVKGPAPVQAFLVPGLFVAAAAGLEFVPFAVRRRLHPWQGQRGIEIVEVNGLVVPATAPRTGFRHLVRVARKSDGVLLVDLASGIAMVPGPSPLAASLPRPQAPPRESRAADPGPERPDSPVNGTSPTRPNPAGTAAQARSLRVEPAHAPPRAGPTTPPVARVRGPSLPRQDHRGTWPLRAALRRPRPPLRSPEPRHPQVAKRKPPS